MSRTPKKLGKDPRPGSRFPSQILGENVREARALRGLKQTDLLARMAVLGHEWIQATLSELERGKRPTSVDELFALAVALRVTVAKLLDPWGIAGQKSTGVDLGVDMGVDTGQPHNAEVARWILLTEEYPWAVTPLYGYDWDDDNKIVGEWVPDDFGETLKSRAKGYVEYRGSGS